MMNVNSMFESKHFKFRTICKEERELYYKLMLDEPDTQDILYQEMKEDLREKMLGALMAFYWSSLTERSNSVTYTILLKPADEFVGQVTLYMNKKSHLEIGISIMKKFRGRGIGQLIVKEWTTCLTDCGDIATQEVDLHIDESNLASRKCFESLGAKYISNANSRYYRLTIPIEKLSSN